MTARDAKAQEAVNGAFGVSYAVARDGEILAMSGAHCHGSETSGAANSDLTFVDWDLFSIVQGEPVRDAYRAIHASVINHERSVSFEYRCDAPDMVRRMSMVISPFKASTGETAALYQSSAIEVRRRLPLPFLDRMRRSNGAELPAVSECAWCARVDDGNGWRKPEQYHADGGASEVKLTHGVCPTCTQTVVAPLLSDPRKACAA